ncbi:UPF0057-domain-containing protein [Athelia psychrophila]|uniref:UPF0057-domain-containing protein n=1 Tax=Athelia psychrophila TaxID=1759441 RepID=A0A166LY24_9AGAM|nr:UPF0057-domain-containing protein [Fibularhizoctonia sp. CBS 109695]
MANYGTVPVATTAPHRKQVSSTHDVCLYIFAILVPPIAVFFKRGCAADFWINICLTILGWIPGVIHAWWVISRHESPTYNQRL